MTRKEACRFLREIFGIRLQPATLAKWFSQGSDGPIAYKAGRAVLYPKELLHMWGERRLGSPSAARPIRAGGSIRTTATRQASNE